MQDKIEKIGNFIVQHGIINNRIYLLNFSWEELDVSINALEKLALEKGYTKTFVKVPAPASPGFYRNNYKLEAYIPGFYNNGNDCLLMSKFYSKGREVVPVDQLKVFSSLLQQVNSQKKLEYRHSLKQIIKILGKDDAKDIAKLYGKVFKTYPFPIYDPDYILKTMEYEKAVYFGVVDGNKLVGLSSAELDIINGAAEMTDFAILPQYRGQNLSFKLLYTMELEMKLRNINTLYTIARLNEPGMNKTFLKAGYKYSGLLVNNTNIAGNIESMNVFYKQL